MLDFKDNHKFGKKLKDTENMQEFIYAISGKKVDVEKFVPKAPPKPATATPNAEAANSETSANLQEKPKKDENSATLQNPTDNKEDNA